MRTFLTAVLAIIGILDTSLAGFAHADGSGKVFEYRIWQEAEIPNEVLMGKSPEAFATTTIARYFRSNHVDCSDLTWLAFVAPFAPKHPNSDTFHSMFGAILNRQLTDDEVKSIQTSLCFGSYPGCKVEIKIHSVNNLSDIRVAYGRDNARTRMSLAGKTSRLPPLTNRCQTGNWRSEATSPEAKLLLTELGIDDSNIEDLSLESYGLSWPFGKKDPEPQSTQPSSGEGNAVREFAPQL